MIYVTPIIITVPTHTSITSTIEQTIAGTVFFKTVDASIPILPIKNDMTSIASINCTRSSIPTPPIVNTIDITGRLDTPNNSTMLYALYVYNQAFKYNDMGYACAMSWFMLVVMGLITFIIFKTSKFWVFSEAN